MSFRVFNLGPSIDRAIQEAEYVEPTPIQAAAIPKILAGHDVIGIAQTGTGKTAAFVLPVLAQLVSKPPKGVAKTTRALILAPTRELAVQIEESVRLYSQYLSLKAVAVYGGVGEQPQIRGLRNRVDLVIATPGRLLDLMEQGHANFSGLEFLVLDEADRMLDMGFLPEIRRLIKQLPKHRQSLLFSATLSQEIEKLTREFLHHPQLVEIGRRSNPAETVTQFVYETSPRLKTSLLLRLLRDSNFNMVLVFTRTKHGADRVTEKLRHEKISVATLHANRSQSQRQRALKDFKAGVVRVLVATDIAARGIDVDGISHVINYDFPKHPEDYVHRIGRTGRAQAVGEAISFVTFEDYSVLHSLERFIGRGLVRKRLEGMDDASEISNPAEKKQELTVSSPTGKFSRFSRRNRFSPRRRSRR